MRGFFVAVLAGMLLPGLAMAQQAEQPSAAAPAPDKDHPATSPGDPIVVTGRPLPPKAEIRSLARAITQVPPSNEPLPRFYDSVCFGTAGLDRPTLEQIGHRLAVDAEQAGLKLAAGRSYLYVTGFYTNFDPLNASFLAFDPSTGRNDVNIPFIGEAQVKGVEFDGSLALTSWFSLNGALTISDPKYKNFQSSTGADPVQAEGKQIVRQPKIYGNIRPSFDFDLGDNAVSVYGRYTYMGKRFVDLYNNTALPAYGTTGAGVTVRHGTWQVQVVGDNLFNAHGLTEGNTRTDQLSGQGSSEAIYGRPIFGRNVRLVVGKSW